MSVRQIWSVALAFVIVVSPGCSLFKIEAHVESDTSWSGAFDNRTVSGRGDMKVDMGARATKCAVVQKQTREGYLTVSITGGDTATTFADFGVVSVCSD